MRQRLRNYGPDIAVMALLFFLPLLVFWGQTVGGSTLIPAENLFQYEPFATYREAAGAPAHPHNALVSDLVLQNMQWKAFIRENLEMGEVPLWNPHQFAGIPFLAAGQQSTLYPLNVIFYTLPLSAAYGWFTVINLWLAGVGMFAFVRGLGVARHGAAIAGITYQLCGFLIASAVFPMILGGAAWLPLLLLMTEFILRRQPFFGQQATIPWLAIGSTALGMNILAGHVEITYYTILITAYYGLFRWATGYWLERGRPGALRDWGTRLLRLVTMGVLGMMLGAVQFVPLYELVNTNWRANGADFATTLSYAHPARGVLQYALPNFYGNPAHHSYRDLFSLERVPIDFINPDGIPKTDTDWGIKNYVEGALYVGILPLVLAVYGLVSAWWPAAQSQQVISRLDTRRSPPYRVIFVVLGLISLTFMFGLPTYAVLYYGFPGLNQSHTPFRWVYAVTFSIAVLAGFGFDALMRLSPFRPKQWFAAILSITGVGTLVALGGSYLFYARLEPSVERLFNGLAKANLAFPDVRAFYSYTFANLLTFAVMTSMSAVVFWLAIYVVHRRRARSRLQDRMDVRNGRRPRWTLWLPPAGDHVVMTAVMLVAMDLMMASGDFNPASDPGLLDYKPPAIAWMTEQPGEWRYTTLDDPAQPPLMQANMGWRYGLDDVRGYESIIPEQYVDYMRALAPQVQLDFNRIAPIYTTYPNNDFSPVDALTSDRLHLLNVRYVMTHRTTDISDVADYEQVYEDEAVQIWENRNTVPRAYAVADDIDQLSEAVLPDEWVEAEIISNTGRELLIDLPGEGTTLILSESYFPGWRAYAQADDGTETELDVQRVQENFIGVALDDPTGTVRVIYSPLSIQLGFFGSALGGLLLLFLLGVWAWQRFVVARDTDNRAILARNSVAPVILNLFNRAIDFIFALVMLRLLGPTDTGVYYYVVVIFVWFDIFTNFGLDVFLTREISRDRSETGRLFAHTTLIRLSLVLIGLILLAGFILLRQVTATEAYDPRTPILLLLLYLGLPASTISKGITSVYYAYERAEYPAAVATLTTVSKVILGLGVLLAGYGIIGLASVSIFNNLMTLLVLAWGARKMIGQLKLQLDRALTRRMVSESWPLMLNNFLAVIFFQIDVVILEPLRGAAIVGKYSVGYRWLLAVNIIPAFFTQAIFPRMSLQAQSNRPLLRRNTTLALKMLAIIVFPISVLFTALAVPLTQLLGGQSFLPEGAIALQIMAWSMPIGWMNSLVQYLLIALDKQRQITQAFFVGVGFNVITNLIFIPIFGYRAAAVTTILSELVLMVGFSLLLRSSLGGINWLPIMARPAAAAAAMGGAISLLWPIFPPLSIVLGSIVYAGVLVVLRPLSADEVEILSPLLPSRVQRIMGSLVATRP